MTVPVCVWGGGFMQCPLFPEGSRGLAPAVPHPAHLCPDCTCRFRPSRALCAREAPTQVLATGSWGGRWCLCHAPLAVHRRAHTQETTPAPTTASAPPASPSHGHIHANERPFPGPERGERKSAQKSAGEAIVRTWRGQGAPGWLAQLASDS